VILYGCVLAEQIGLPVPAVPILLGVGALAGGGQMSLILALGVVLAASLPPDLAWFELGRRRGPRVLARICAISLEPDWCVRRTEALFIRFGRKLLLVAKFLPGLSAVASPLAGSAGVPRWQFLLLDVTGALVWSGTWLGIGYAFSDALDIVARWVARLGSYGLLLAGRPWPPMSGSSTRSGGGSFESYGWRASPPRSCGGGSTLETGTWWSSIPDRCWTCSECRT
jgi:membrane protein DedA with SNARE-associated domain